MDNETNLNSAYDSLQKKELEQRKTIKQMSERIKELEALVSKNESLNLVMQCPHCLSMDTEESITKKFKGFCQDCDKFF